MTDELTQRLFEWIVEDPFYSQTFGCQLRIDDYSIVHQTQEGNESYMMDLKEGTDGGIAMIKLLYKDWYNHQVSEAGNDFITNCSAPNPSQI